MDVKHIRNELTVNFDDESVSGTTTLSVSPIGEPLTEIRLDAVEFDVHAAKINGTAVDFEATDEEVILYPATPLPAGQDPEISVSFTAKPSRGLHFRTKRMGYSEDEVSVWSQGEPEDNRHWFPSFDFPNERATSEMIVTVPDEFVALSNGDKLDERVDSARGLRTVHWKLDVPHPSYLVTLAVGHFVEIEDASGVVPMKHYVRKEFADDAHLSFRKTDKMMRFFQDWIGVPYPYKTYGHVAVVDFIYGGMENSTLTTLTERTLHDEGAHLTRSSDGLVAHELAHQWWGDLLTCRDWSHLWLNEGFATYFQCLFVEHDLGRDDFLYEMLGYQRDFLRSEARIPGPVVNNRYDDAVDAINGRVYDKGTWILHMLRSQLGDERFQEAIRTYCRRFAHRPVETNDLMRTIEDVTGEGMEPFFDQWLYHGGFPELEASYEWNEDAKIAMVTVKQTQQVNGVTPLFDLHTTIRFSVDGEPVDAPIRISKAVDTVYVKLSQRPDYAVVDPNGELLKKLEFKKPAAMLIAQTKSDSVLARIDAAEGLARFKTDNALDALKNLLENDPFWGVRVEAAKALAEIEHDGASVILIDALDQEDARVRVAAAEGLAHSDTEEAAKRLAAAVENDPSPYVVSAAISSLGEGRHQAARKIIAGALDRESHNDTVATSAISALPKLDGAAAADRLRRIAGSNRSRAVRSRAIAALGVIGQYADDETKEKIAGTLTPLLDRPNRFLRGAAVRALSTLGADSVIPELEHLAETTRDDNEQQSVERAIAAIRDRKAQGDAVQDLREKVESLEKTNSDLDKRIEKLEQLLAKPEN